MLVPSLTGQMLAVYDASATSMTACLASGMTSVARSDYAGNVFSDYSYPASGECLTFMVNLGTQGPYVAATSMSPSGLEAFKRSLLC